MARIAQPSIGSEAELLEQWLEFQRATLAMKCEGLSSRQLALPTCPPSTLSLARILRHIADMERFGAQMLRGEPVAARYDSGESAGRESGREATDRDRALHDWTKYDVDDDALGIWREECSEMRQALGTYESPSQTLPGEHSALSVRALVLALTAEYARHNGHADLLRESIDGARGY